MESDKAVELLKSKGFTAYIEKGVVMIASNDPDDAKTMESILSAAGYIASRGWKKVAGVAREA